MDALEILLTAPPDRRCEACRHARPTARDGLYCGRSAGSPYPCAVERASAPIEAWLYGACGRQGRFFEASAAGLPARVAGDALSARGLPRAAGTR
jgi:hypothetical protein